jgi:hypothetical protein
MIDLDGSLYVEYDNGTKEPLALVANRPGLGRAFKAGLPCYCVLYTMAK